MGQRGLVTSRLPVSAPEEFRQETVEESKRIEEVRNLLVEADDPARPPSGGATRQRASSSSRSAR
jgi:hypothetical protein